MARFLVSRAVGAVVTLLVASFAVYVLVFANGDPGASVTVMRPCAVAGPAAECPRQVGVLEGYADTMVGLGRPGSGYLQGDLGVAQEFGGEPARTLLARRAAPTAVLMLAATLLGLVLGVGLGALAAARPGSALDRLLGTGTLVWYSVPPLLLALLLQLGVLEIHDRTGTLLVPLAGPADAAAGPAEYARASALPVLTLVPAFAAGWSRHVRNALVGALAADHVTGARARGVPEGRIRRHALRLAAVPLCLVVAADLPVSLSSALLVDFIFGYGGLGTLMIRFERANGRYVLIIDPHLFLAIVALLVLVVVVVNAAADIALAALDPRVRLR